MDKNDVVLIVDDNKDLLRSLEQMLRFDFENVITLHNPNVIMEILSANKVDVVLLDMNFKEGDNSGADGLLWLKRIQELKPGLPVVLITAYGDINIAVKAMKNGASDFITKPWEPQRLIVTIKNTIQLSRTKQKLYELEQENQAMREDKLRSVNAIIGSSAVMRSLNATIMKVAKTDANVLLLGENGTGKELIAREIHRKSLRNNHHFVSVDMGSISESLFESELFGPVKGAFTDAHEQRMGRFELATKGTLFLDEIGNISVSLQSKLLAALQNREVVRVGSSQKIPVDIRLISATNKNLEDLIRKDLFREDLLYRLNTITIDVPPLRDREEDIILLADYYLEYYTKKYNKLNLKLSTRSYEKMMTYQWPGNIRELRHSLEKAVILNEEGIIKPHDLFHNQSVASSKELYTLKLGDLERTAITKALNDAKGNMSLAAKTLDISRTTLYSKIKKYGL